ncbi:TPA: N-6 DNA methylase [Streptococcus suis]|nr:N-6 DNA methylase [Streptococcus suis]HEM5207366.1 N-6 DNA methylase [Streptococcus suis]HEM5227940.1 N-6 DNA methylase [Streptococcus suis]HEM5238254.1 N-6 DNA methylase [Streptococcus suis]
MTFIEHNNRKRANKFAEYITSPVLRQYLADKVKRYCGDDVSVFDGAAGSGQLEQFINPSEFHAVEIQQEACDALKENYEHAIVHHMSFFQYQQDILVDAIAMNPPYSIKFKDLPEDDRQAIRDEFPWKKSGVVDDIFLLKSLKYTKRYGFYIMFPGIAYRGTEKIMRQTIGNQLAELNAVRNGFEDTGIEVLFLVIDKEKTTQDVYREIYDAKLKKVVHTDGCQLTDDYHWETPREPQVKEEIDIDAVNKELNDLALQHLENHLNSQLLAINFFEADIDLLRFISNAYDILNKYEIYYNFGVAE